MSPILVTVTGGIGTGKTTVVRSFQNDNEIRTIEESIDKWKMIHSTNLLEECTKYNRRCMEFQLQILNNVNRLFFEEYGKATEKQIILTDRGNEDPHKIFIPAMLKSNRIDIVQAEILTESSTFMSQQLLPKYYIYLKSSPQKCMERICKRGRYEENEIERSYIEMLCSLYENWLLPLDNSFCIDVDNLSIKQVYAECKQILDEIKYIEN